MLAKHVIGDFDFDSTVKDLSSANSRIPDPRFRIPDLGFQVQEEQLKRRAKIFFPTFFVVTNIAKLKLNFCELVKKNVVPITNNYRTFYPNNCH